MPVRPITQDKKQCDLGGGWSQSKFCRRTEFVLCAPGRAQIIVVGVQSCAANVDREV